MYKTQPTRSQQARSGPLGFPSLQTPLSPEVWRCTLTSVRSPTPPRSPGPLLPPVWHAAERSRQAAASSGLGGLCSDLGAHLGVSAQGSESGHLGLTSWADTGVAQVAFSLSDAHHPARTRAARIANEPIANSSVADPEGKPSGEQMGFMKPFYLKRGASVYY